MISYSGKTLLINGSPVDLEHPIAEAFEADGKLLVLFDPDARTEKFGQFPNLVALSVSGEKLWTAELPTTTSGDRYYKIASKRPLVVYSIYSEECEIDPDIGKIVVRRPFR